MRWRRHRWLIVLLAALVLYALIGFVVVPWIAERAILPRLSHRIGSEISVDRIRCNPFNLSLTLEGLSIPDRSGEPMLAFERMFANAQVSSVLRWAVTLEELSIESPFVALRRLPDGGINLGEVVDAVKSSAETPEEERHLPRAVLQEIRIDDGRIEIEDQARAEPLMWTAGPAQLTLHDISTLPEKTGDNVFVIGLQEGGTMRVEGEVTVEPLGLDGTLSIDKSMVANLWSAVADRFEFTMTGGEVATDLQYHVRLQDDGLHLMVDDTGFTLTDLQVHTKDTNAELATLDKVEVRGFEAAWPEQQVRADTLLVDGATAQVWLEADGTPSWASLVPEKTQQQIVKTYEEYKDQIHVNARLGRFEVRNASAGFEDRTLPEPHRIEIADAELVLTEISTEPESRWGLAASAAVGDARAVAKGTFVAAPVDLEVEVGLENLELSQFQAYVEQVAPLDLLAGVLNVAGSARVTPRDETGKVKFQGRLEVRGLDLDETVTGGKLLGWGGLEVEGIEAALVPITLEVAKADVYGAGLEISVAEDGTINLLQFTQALGEDSQASEGDGTAEASTHTGEKNLPPARIDRLELHDCFGVYHDATTIEPFEHSLKAINGTVSNISTDGTSEADVDLQAALDTGGAVAVSGRMDLFEYARLTDLAIDIREVVLPPLSPMSVKIIGFPIEQGRSSLDLDYAITDYQLAATNHVEIDNLQLGEKIAGEGKIHAPIKLGVSMLKDKNGQITLDFPMQGDLRDPEFVMASAISSAIAGVAGDLVKSPFRMLGRLVGGSDDQDLEVVDFAPGSAVLEPHDEANLTTLAKAFDERPELGLEVSGTVDPQLDLTGLREAALYRELGVDPVSVESLPLTPLESEVEMLTSPGEVAMMRGEFMSDDNSLDEERYRQALLARLLDSQVVSDAELDALAGARAEAIRAFLVEKQGIDASRVIVLPEIVAAETGEPRVRCQLGLTARD